jgi:hypothetical protein
MEGAFIPVREPKLSAKWYDEKLGFSSIYIEEDGMPVNRLLFVRVDCIWKKELKYSL